MKLIKSTMFFIVLSLFSTRSYCQNTGQMAPNATLTDVNGVSYNIHDIVGQGYKVILDFSYELCGPCKAWAENVGHDLWDEYGPNGDNTLRMFHIDVDPVSDWDVISYTSNWGVTYPVINDNGVMPEYSSMVVGYPTLVYICQDTSYLQEGGYGYPSSLIDAQIAVNTYCEGVDLQNDYFLYGVEGDPVYCALDNNTYNYTPRLIIAHSAQDNNTWIDQVFDVETFINNVSVGTQSVDPWASGGISTMFSEFLLANMAVSPGDLVRFEIDYPGDTYSGNNSTEILIPTIAPTPTSTSTIINYYSPDQGCYFDVYDWNDNWIDGGQGSGMLTIPNGVCYYVKILNTYQGAQVWGNDGTAIVDIYPSTTGVNPMIYFNVNDGAITGIEEVTAQKDIESIAYFDLMGRKQDGSYQDLPEGIYLKVTSYTDGTLSSEKVFHSK